MIQPTSVLITGASSGIGAALAEAYAGPGTSLFLHGMNYDYSVDLRIDDTRNIRDLVSLSRFSLINSLVDHRAGIGLGIDMGLKEWVLDYTTWRGAVDGGRTDSVTLRFLTPMGRRSDIEFGLGYDDSELYGDVMFFSVFAYFYGGD